MTIVIILMEGPMLHSWVKRLKNNINIGDFNHQKLVIRNTRMLSQPKLSRNPKMTLHIVQCVTNANTRIIFTAKFVKFAFGTLCLLNNIWLEKVMPKKFYSSQMIGSSAGNLRKKCLQFLHRNLPQARTRRPS